MAELAEEQMLEYLDGPKFVEWLEEQGINKQACTESQRKRLTEWKHGSRANIYTDTTDSLLTDNYLAISSIPDDVWSKNQAHSSSGHHYTQTVSPEQRRQRKEDAELMLIQGDKTVKAIASEVGVSEGTVGTWKRELRKQGLVE